MTHPDYLSLNEQEFTSQIRDLARTLQWARYHTWISKHSTAGFPDEVLVRPPRVIFAELKSENGKLTPAQRDWLDALALCGTVEVYVWRPSMIDQIAHCLQRVGRPRDLGPGAWGLDGTG